MKNVLKINAGTALLRKLLIYSVFINLMINSIAQDNQEDYSIYHQYICRAETLFFINENIDSCLFYYDIAFRSFEFNYIHDLVNATQIAWFKDRPFMDYLKKASLFGLKSNHLLNVPMFLDRHSSVSILKGDVIAEFERYEKTKEYKQNRKKYIQSINFEYLDWFYQFCMEEKIATSDEAYENDTNKDNKEEQWWSIHLDTLLENIKLYGYPGQKVIGITDNLIFAEYGKPELDMNNRRLPYQDILCVSVKDPINVVIGEETLTITIHGDDSVCHPVIHDDAMTNDLLLVDMFHYFVSLDHSLDVYLYNKLQSIWEIEIRKGNMHPRMMAFLHDVMHSIHTSFAISFAEFEKLKETGVGNVFSIKLDHLQVKNPNIPDPNPFRSQYNIVPLEVDEAKMQYEEKYGFNLFWGYHRCL
jgi:hypothetical protein